MTDRADGRGSGKTQVAHIDHTVAPGGAEIALARLIQAGPSWAPYLFVPKGSDQNSVLSRAPFSKVVCVGPMQKPGLTRASILGVLSFLSSLVRHVGALCLSPSFRAVDIVHANSSRAAVYAAIAARILRKPLVVHLRDAVSTESLGPLGHLVMSKLVLPSARGVVANSEYTMKIASEYVNAEAIRRVIPSPVGVSRRMSPLRERDEVLSVGMVARVAEWKGQRLLLEAFARAFHDGSARLKLVGGTDLGGQDYLNSLRDRARALGIADRVDFLGQVPSSEVESLIDGFDVCVQASIRPEPLGQNVLQYLARARPTIAADQGGPVEWVTDRANGRLFSTGSVEDLVRMLDELKPRRVREVLSAGAIATPLPTADTVLEMHRRLYKACMPS